MLKGNGARDIIDDKKMPSRANDGRLPLILQILSSMVLRLIFALTVSVDIYTNVLSSKAAKIVP